MALDVLDSATVRAQIAWNATKNVTGLTGIVSNESLSKTLSFTLGSGAAAIDQVVSQVRTLSASASETLDLNGGLTNVTNDASVVMVRVKAVFIQLLSTTDDSTNGTAASSITIGNAASNQFTGPLGGATETLTVPNGGFVMFGRGDASGWASTAGSADNLKVVNNDGSNSAAYRITIFGAST